MAKVSKPCERYTKGCRDLVFAPGPLTLAKRRFCSHRCSYLHRVESGAWHNPTVPLEQRRVGGKRGGRESGRVRHRLAMIRRAERIVHLLTPELRTGLSDRQEAAIKVMLCRAYASGYNAGVSAAWSARNGTRPANSDETTPDLRLRANSAEAPSGAQE